MNLNKLVDIEIEGIDRKDFPDFCDAFIVNASTPRYPFLPKFVLKLAPSLLYRELTEAELDQVNDNKDFVYERVIDRLF